MSKLFDIDKQYLQPDTSLNDLQAEETELGTENITSLCDISSTQNEFYFNSTSEQLGTKADAATTSMQALRNTSVKECMNPKADIADITQTETDSTKDIDSLLADSLYALHTRVTKLIKQIFKSE